MPLLPSWNQSHADAGVSPKRLVVFASVLGTYPDRFWPRPPGSTPLPPDHRPSEKFDHEAPARELREFILPRITAPLAPHQDSMVAVAGLAQAASGHGQYASALTGLPLPDDVDSGRGRSADQIIADAIGQDTRFRSLHFGVRTSGQGGEGGLSWYGAGQGAGAEPDPRVMFDLAFSDLDTDPEQLRRLRERRRSVLDAVREQSERVKTQLGVEDRAKLDDYLDSVRDVEMRLTNDAALGCVAPPRPAFPTNEDLDPPWEVDPNVTPAIYDAHVDLAAMALACDLTRVATVQLGYEGTMQTHPWLGVDIPHHSLSHTDPTADSAIENFERIGDITQWHAEGIARFIDNLKAIPEGSGTVFDNTLVLWLHTMTYGDAHTSENVPVIMLGNPHGYFRTPLYRRYSQEDGMPRRRTAELLASIMDSFGVEVDTFGQPDQFSGPLDELRA